MSLFTENGADFSKCRQYRYRLWRYWNPTKPFCLFIMLNPSTAGEIENDPTVERCERRALQMGFGGLVVCNIFAFRATDPQAMKAALDPVGPHNDWYIRDEAKRPRTGRVICGWGEHGKHRGRSKAVTDMLRQEGVTLYYLRLNKSGEPQHPLYIGYDQKPQAWHED